MIINVPNVRMSFSKYFLVFGTFPNKCSTFKDDRKYVNIRIREDIVK
jgi:hypothetical protein